MAYQDGVDPSMGNTLEGSCDSQTFQALANEKQSEIRGRKAQVAPHAGEPNRNAIIVTKRKPWGGGLAGCLSTTVGTALGMCWARCTHGDTEKGTRTARERHEKTRKGTKKVQKGDEKCTANTRWELLPHLAGLSFSFGKSWPCFQFPFWPSLRDRPVWSATGFLDS